MTHHERDDRQALAAGETYLIHVLETSDPPGNPDHYRITDAVEAHHASTGSYDVEAGGPDADKAEDALRQRARDARVRIRRERDPKATRKGRRSAA